MERRDQQRIIRDAFRLIKSVPCFNRDSAGCNNIYSYPNGLSYHLERCGVDKKVVEILVIFAVFALKLIIFW